MKNSFYIAGGDLRSVYLAKALLKEGYEVKVFGLEKADLPAQAEHVEKTDDFEEARILILPLPCCDSRCNPILERHRCILDRFRK
jgi:hypothetical protein